ncbi:uncharacterized protein LOC110466995 isoform X2 [Mizuhopecten yessoensis]|uniref:NFX1-type zinc finger-containing protein 1 n=1 Tax=Mizuhopecten yessoensis TaxID=6573 RepID=A0A210PMS8_MIZYE|nr:uncharacterized protein LOC110466995 isoform X2 [Mizuhopecten yessoensis]OWF37810.1 NFX1-type zinc finger-containing protein 1 [Mizuhopecten yessoensis]
MDSDDEYGNNTGRTGPLRILNLDDDETENTNGTRRNSRQGGRSSGPGGGHQRNPESSQSRSESRGGNAERGHRGDGRRRGSRGGRGGSRGASGGLTRGASGGLTRGAADLRRYSSLSRLDTVPNRNEDVQDATNARYRDSSRPRRNDTRSRPPRMFGYRKLSELSEKTNSDDVLMELLLESSGFQTLLKNINMQIDWSRLLLSVLGKACSSSKSHSKLQLVGLMVQENVMMLQVTTFLAKIKSRIAVMPPYHLQCIIQDVCKIMKELMQRMPQEVHTVSSAVLMLDAIAEDHTFNLQQNPDILELINDVSTIMKTLVQDIDNQRRDKNIQPGGRRNHRDMESLPPPNNFRELPILPDLKDLQFNETPNGGCTTPCETRLPCGHVCEQYCHIFDSAHQKYRCLKPCAQVCDKGHVCTKKCWEECGKCMKNIIKTIPVCRHEQLGPCHQDPHSFKCRSKCEKKLICGHICSGTCGKCKEYNTHQIQCPELIQRKLICGHFIQCKCYQRIEDFSCTEKCTTKLDCGHPCSGTCGGCFQGRLHVPCFEKCTDRKMNTSERTNSGSSVRISYDRESLQRLRTSPYSGVVPRCLHRADLLSILNIPNDRATTETKEVIESEEVTEANRESIRSMAPSTREDVISRAQINSYGLQWTDPKPVVPVGQTYVTHGDAGLRKTSFTSQTDRKLEAEEAMDINKEAVRKMSVPSRKEVIDGDHYNPTGYQWTDPKPVMRAANTSSQQADVGMKPPCFILTTDVKRETTRSEESMEIETRSVRDRISRFQSKPAGYQLTDPKPVEHAAKPTSRPADSEWRKAYFTHQTDVKTEITSSYEEYRRPDVKPVRPKYSQSAPEVETELKKTNDRIQIESETDSVPANPPIVGQKQRTKMLFQCIENNCTQLEAPGLSGRCQEHYACAKCPYWSD